MDETRWLDERELRTWVRLAALVELLPGVLDTQLRRDAHLTHFEYFTMAMLSEAPGRTLRMSTLAARTNATPPRLSHVARRLEDRGFIARSPSPEDGRITNAHLTDEGYAQVVEAAPGHVATVRTRVLDALTDEQVEQLGRMVNAILERVDPDQLMTAPYEPPTTGRT